jgi:L-cysteine S-thiosulfotransferase
MIAPLYALPSAVAVSALLVMAAGFPSPVAAAEKSAQSVVEQGKEIAFDRKKGNCLACHAIAGGDSPGDIGPPLAGIKDRYPDKAKLRAQIYDSTVANPHTVMPPYGRNRILTEPEIDKIVEFVYTL